MTTSAQVGSPGAAAAQDSAGTAQPGPSLRSRFRQQRLARWSCFFLVLLGVTAAGADFFAPHAAGWHNRNFLNAPPQCPEFSWTDGFHVRALVPRQDPVTLRWVYRDGETKVPLAFLVRCESYRLLGIWPMSHRFWGVAPEARAGETFFPLGTDGLGRDVLSRVLLGSRVSLSLAVLAVALMMVIGVVVGSVSGYCGGWVDSATQRTIEVINSFPHLPLFLGLSAALPKDWSVLQTYLAITLILTLLGWTGIARVVRGKVLALRGEDYVVAARLLGAGSWRIMARHILPGFYGHLVVSATLAVPTTILGETSLSFLGLGLRDPVASWGVMIQDCVSFEAMGNYPWLFAPVVAVIATVMALTFIGDGLREALDPRASAP